VGTVARVDLTTLLATPAAQVTGADAEAYLKHAAQALPATVDTTLPIPPGQHRVRLTLTTDGTPCYRLLEPALIAGIRVTNLLVRDERPVVSVDSDRHDPEDWARVNHAVELAMQHPPLSTLASHLRHLELAALISHTAHARSAEQTNVGWDARALREYGGPSESLTRDLARYLNELAATAPCLTPDQARLAETLYQAWEGSPLELLETVTAATLPA
jgi:D-ribose pyranose/furanose isomerase RbsD